MDSIEPRCTPLKQRYDACFTEWYSNKFLKGDVTPACDELLRDYKACVLISLREKGLDKMIEEGRRRRQEHEDAQAKSASR